MRLVDVSTTPDAADVLWQLMAERTPQANISHKAMPSIAEHQAFVASKPYECWYLVDVGADRYAGAVYLSKQREIGVGILRRYWGNGYGKAATQLLMAKHPGRFLANINPLNRPSTEMFLDLGFKQLQVTYELPPPWTVIT